MSDLVRPVEHGGDLEAATAAYGAPKGGWLDLSTGINPMPYPLPPIADDAWTQLPSRAALYALIEAARAAYGVPDRAALAAAPGAQGAISLLPRVVEPGRRVAVVSPTYGEHARAWALAGHEVREVPTLPKAEGLDIVALCNPDNPTGRVFDIAELMALADDLGVRGGTLVVDESFVDPVPARSLAKESPHPALVVIRSFGKFYGHAGIRLGFVFGARRLVTRLEGAFGPWPVSGPAMTIALSGLRDEAWVRRTRHQLVERSNQLGDLLEKNGFSPIGATPLFRLVSAPNARRIHDALAREGIWTRAFPYAPQWLRFGLPGTDADFGFLERALGGLVARRGGEPHAGA
jgi:cobalamin biosynthetic protein CobC